MFQFGIQGGRVRNAPCPTLPLETKVSWAWHSEPHLRQTFYKFNFVSFFPTPYRNWPSTIHRWRQDFFKKSMKSIFVCKWVLKIKNEWKCSILLKNTAIIVCMSFTFIGTSRCCCPLHVLAVLIYINRNANSFPFFFLLVHVSSGLLLVRAISCRWKMIIDTSQRQPQSCFTWRPPQNILLTNNNNSPISLFVLFLVSGLERTINTNHRERYRISNFKFDSWEPVMSSMNCVILTFLLPKSFTKN